MSTITRRAALMLGLAAVSTACAAQPRPSAVGVAAPLQPHAHLAVLDAEPARLKERLREVAAIAADHSEAVTVGLGPSVLTGLPLDLPEFPREHVPARARHGDVLLKVASTTQDDVTALARRLVDVFGGPEAVRWSQTCAAAPHPLGLADGISQPDDLAASVWLDSPGWARGGTIAVVRRMRIDVAGFAALPPAERERVIGRRASGEPLSGGDRTAAVNLFAKNPDGTYVIPADAHVRRAHPGPVGAPLMLRRSYGYDNGTADRGLVFVSYQRELRTFVETMRRMSEADRLLEFTTTTATGAFLVLPEPDQYPL